MSATAGAAGTECFEHVDEVAELYAAQDVRVRRLVRLNVQAPDALVEDACQVAWMRLVLHRTRVRRDAAIRWLVRVAVNEAFKLIRRGARELSLDELSGDGGGEVSEARLRGPAQLDELAEHRARLETIRDLPARQQRLVWLQGLGFTYEEMADETGTTRRTVERQLLRAKGTLARAQP